jgi:hypothetical protein
MIHAGRRGLVFPIREVSFLVSSILFGLRDSRPAGGALGESRLTQGYRLEDGDFAASDSLGQLATPPEHVELDRKLTQAILIY